MEACLVRGTKAEQMNLKNRHENENRGSQRPGGFTLIELMIVVVIIVILLSIAIPLFLRYRMSANEAAALAGIRLISTGEAGFIAAGFVDVDDDGNGDFGTLEQLGNPGSGSEPFIDELLAAGTRNGYEFSVELFAGLPELFSARALPIVLGKSGRRSYYVDQSMVVRFDPEGSPSVGPSSPPVN